MRHSIFVLLLSALGTTGFSQLYTAANAHSHNDYEQAFPFWGAYNQGFGSIEADIFLQGDELLVAHDKQELLLHRRLDSLYLLPLQSCILQNNGRVYRLPNRRLQLMIDIKTNGEATLDALVALLQKFPTLTATPSLQIVISGSRPPQQKFASYPYYIFFDGETNVSYTPEALSKIAMLSNNFQTYSSWNGKGIIPAKERLVLEALVKEAHSLGKKIRFWNAPDTLNAWYGFMKLGVDYINTDHVQSIGTFFTELPNRTYTATSTYPLYTPKYRNDGENKPVKNIILLIGDGNGLAQWYTGYTANKAALNVFNMKHIGLSKTSSYDSYITDSAPGSTAFSSGEKTNNRAVGVDHTGQKLLLLPDILAEQKKKTGLVTCGDITDATPADFYAHQTERSNATAILKDLATANVDLLFGSGNTTADTTVAHQLKARFTLVNGIDSVGPDQNTRWVSTENKAGLSMLNGRGDWLQRAFTKATDLLSKNKQGFFLMLEGAQIDYGGHADQLPYVVTEVTDFDQVIGKAMAFADSNGETLVIVAADHETGGLTLTAGDYTTGYISGQFSTNDHTAIPIPVFAYGPQSQLFNGVYENTEIFRKILQATSH